MAESFLFYKGWSNEFEVGDFALTWLVIETALDTDLIKENPLALQGRLQHLIDTDCLGEDWYHSTCLDPIIGSDEGEFHHVLSTALWSVRQAIWQQKNLWPSLKRPDLAMRVASNTRFREPSSLESFLGVLISFALPALVPGSENDIMRSLGWHWRPEAGVNNCESTAQRKWQPGATWTGRFEVHPVLLPG